MDKALKEIVLNGIIVEDSYVLTLEEAGDKFDIEKNFLEEMLAYGILETKPPTQAIAIDQTTLKKIHKALHLHQDLEINMAGAALVLDLLEELENLRTQMSIMQKHLK